MSKNRLLEDLLKLDECDFLDFKEKFKSKEDFIIDVLSMSNLTYNGSRYLVYGIENKTKKIIGLDSAIEKNNCTDILHNGSVYPKIYIQVHNLIFNDKNISIVEIPENKGDIFVSKKDHAKLKANHIYSRYNDTNRIADPDVIEALIQKKLSSTNINPNLKTFKTRTEEHIDQRFLAALSDINGWKTIEEFDRLRDEHVTTYAYVYDTKFCVKSYHHMDNFNEPYTEVCLDPRATAYEAELIYDKQKIDSIYYTSVDGARLNIVYPEKEVIYHDKTFTEYFYYILNTKEYHFSAIIQNPNFYIDRICNRRFPIFESKTEAIAAINKDFNGTDRLLASYTRIDKAQNNTFLKYDIYPKYFDGLPVSARSELLKGHQK